MANNVIKCLHCGKYFIDIDQEKCPFCHKSVNDDLQIFKNLFGEDNPFDNFGRS
jgi:phage FluMu protein Com